MECFWGIGASRKHYYLKQKTWLLGRVYYECTMCWSNISEKEYNDWVRMHEERDKLLEEYMKRRIET